MQRLSNKQKLWLTIIIAGIALILQYGFHYPLLAQIIVTIAGAIVALTMLVGMVKTLRSGKYGVTSWQFSRSSLPSRSANTGPLWSSSSC